MELKPCPFCGSENISIRTDGAVYDVWCNDCGCVYFTEEKDKEKAIKEWNERGRKK